MSEDRDNQQTEWETAVYAMADHLQRKHPSLSERDAVSRAMDGNVDAETKAIGARAATEQLQRELEKWNPQVHTLHFTADQIARISSLFADIQKAGGGDVKANEEDRAIVQKLDQAAIRARYQPSDEEVAKSGEDLAQRASLRLRF